MFKATEMLRCVSRLLMAAVYTLPLMVCSPGGSMEWTEYGLSACDLILRQAFYIHCIQRNRNTCYANFIDTASGAILP